MPTHGNRLQVAGVTALARQLDPTRLINTYAREAASTREHLRQTFVERQREQTRGPTARAEAARSKELAAQALRLLGDVSGATDAPGGGSARHGAGRSTAARPQRPRSRR